MTKIFLFIILSLCIVSAWGKPQTAQEVTANPEECALCDALISSIESWVDSNKTETEIETLLDQVCTHVPKFETICDTIIAAGVPAIINMIEQKYPPSTICGWFGFCDASQMEPQKQPQAPSECSVCEELINVMESWLASEKGIQEIETLLDQICSHVPKFEETCDKIVAAGVPTVIAWIEQYENATVVCTQLHACSVAEEDVDVDQVLQAVLQFNDEFRKNLFKSIFRN